MRTILLSIVCTLPISTSHAQSIDLLAANRLEQWVNAQGDPIDRPQWQLNEGELHLTHGGGGDIFFRESVGDFLLTWEWKISPGGNSGVKYRVTRYGSSWLGCEYQIQDDADQTPTRHTTAALYAVYEPNLVRPPLPAGQWNSARILVAGNQIEHWLNGDLVLRAWTDSDEWNRRVEESKFRPHDGWGQNRVGRIMLQDHGNEVWFRNIRLTRLDTYEAGPLSRETWNADCCPMGLSGVSHCLGINRFGRPLGCRRRLFNRVFR